MADPNDLFYVTGGKEIRAFDIAGRQVWSHKFTKEWTSKYTSMMVMGDLLLVARQGKVWAFDRQSGQVIWEVEAPDTKNRPPMMTWAGGGDSQGMMQQAAMLQQQQAAMAATAGAGGAAAAASS